MATRASTAPPSLTIPQLALQEATGHSNVVVETLDGCTYSGKVRSVEKGTGNIHMDTTTHREKDGDLSVMARVVIKGSSVAMVRLPTVIRNAPFLEAMNSVAASLAHTASHNASSRRAPGINAQQTNNTGGKKKFGNGKGGGLTTDVLLRKSARDARKAAAASGKSTKGKKTTH
jgi:small nuclear ribonucleoprotein (snRNP)-like protein